MYSGNGVSVHMNPPKNSGQIATFKFIKEEITDYRGINGYNPNLPPNNAYRWQDITNGGNYKLFTFDNSGNYPLSNNNELLCLGYVMSFSGETSCSLSLISGNTYTMPYFFDGLSGSSSYNVWTGNTGCTES